MLTFETLYQKRADLLFLLCTKLEGDQEVAEILFQDVWRRIHSQFGSALDQDEEIWLFTRLLDSHRRVQRRLQGRPSLESTGSPLMSLPSEFRWPLVLREFAGFDYAQIGRTLGLPEPTVRTRLSRARALLRKAMEDAVVG